MKTERTRNLLGIWAFSILLLLGFSPSASAETEEERRERTERLQDLKRTEEVTGTTSKLWSQVSKKLGWFVDYGGTARHTYTGGKDNDRFIATKDSLAFTKDYELNLYLNMVNLIRTNKFYSRIRTTYTERKKNAASTRGNEWTQLEVDLLYFEKKIKAAGSNTTMTVGRHSVSVGRGIAYSAAADGVSFDISYKRNKINMFGVKADRSPDDHDPGNISPPSPSRNHTHRSFIGGEFKWNFSKISPYIYVVKGRDNSSRQLDPQSTQVHIYKPTFFGYGFNGNITPRLTFFGEFIRVDGSTTSRGDITDTTPVNADAFDIGLRYNFRGRHRPSISYEYAYGSGDPDRQSTVNSTNLGNTAGTSDEVFRPFGGLSLGYALAPTLANLKAQKLGVSITPFARSKYDLIRDIRLDVDYFQFERDVTPGPISDFSAFANADARKRIGQEIDAQINWQLWSDLKLNVRFGLFAPHPDSYGVKDGTIVIRRGANNEYYWKLQWSLDI